MTDVAVIATGLGFTEGPVAMDDGTIWVTSIPAGLIYQLSQDGAVLQSVSTGGGPNGLARSADGTLYVAQNGGVFFGGSDVPGGIQRVRDGVVEQILDGLVSPNDLCFGPDDRLYFTDPRVEGPPAPWPDMLVPESSLPGRLYACDRDGSNLELVTEGPRFINGLAFGPGDDELFVAETAKPHRILRATFTDGKVGPFEEHFVLKQGWPDGFAIADDGSFWVATLQGRAIDVYNRDGSFLRSIDCGAGSHPTNICFGVGDDKNIYITDSEREAVLRYPIPASLSGLTLHG